jgi:hypothetical protein
MRGIARRRRGVCEGGVRFTIGQDAYSHADGGPPGIRASWGPAPRRHSRNRRPP